MIIITCLTSIVSNVTTCYQMWPGMMTKIRTIWTTDRHRSIEPSPFVFTLRSISHFGLARIEENVCNFYRFSHWVWCYWASFLLPVYIPTTSCSFHTLVKSRGIPHGNALSVTQFKNKESALGQSSRLVLLRRTRPRPGKSDDLASD